MRIIPKCVLFICLFAPKVLLATNAYIVPVPSYTATTTIATPAWGGNISCLMSQQAPPQTIPYKSGTLPNDLYNYYLNYTF